MKVIAKIPKENASYIPEGLLIEYNNEETQNFDDSYRYQGSFMVLLNNSSKGFTTPKLKNICEEFGYNYSFYLNPFIVEQLKIIIPLKVMKLKLV